MTRPSACVCLLAAACLGLAGSGVAWWLRPGPFYRAWLAAVMAMAAWPLGSLALLLVHSLTGGRWGDALRPALLAGVATLPLLLPASLPLLIGAGRLYPWVAAHGALANGFYLNPAFAVLRWVAYWVVWFGLGGWVWRRAAGPLRPLAAPGLLLLAATVTFAAIDGAESLDPHFNSSIWGMLTAASFGLDAFAAAVAVTLLLAPPDTAARRDLARLLLGLAILWAYLEFMQALIVWESDLPAEAAWYLPRVAPGWDWVAGAVAILHFAAPFFLLLAPRAQASRRVPAVAAGLVLVGGGLRWCWVVLPAGAMAGGWASFAVPAATMAGLIGCSAVLFRAAWRRLAAEAAHG